MSFFANIKAVVPPASRVWGLVQLALGATLGWFVNPLLWIAQPLPIWIANVLAIAAQESYYQPGAVGDLDAATGESYGLLQFNQPVAEELFGADWEVRVQQPWRQGCAAAAYVQSALSDNIRWWLIVVPVYGFALLRWMWTSGRTDDSVEAALNGDGNSGQTAWARYKTETLAQSAYIMWTTLAVIGTALVYFGVSARKGGKRARRR